MALEMRVPSPGESITEVEIATWLVEDGDYVEKDQAIAEVDSDKATLELPAEESGIITLKAEEGDAVAVGEVVCLIDTDAAKPEGAGAVKKEVVESAKKEVVVEAPTKKESYATGSPSPAAKRYCQKKTSMHPVSKVRVEMDELQNLMRRMQHRQWVLLVLVRAVPSAKSFLCYGEKLQSDWFLQKTKRPCLLLLMK